MKNWIVLCALCLSVLMYYPPEPGIPAGPQPIEQLLRPSIDIIIQAHSMAWTEIPQPEPAAEDESGDACPAHLAADGMCNDYIIYVLHPEIGANLAYQGWLAGLPAENAALLPAALPTP